MKLDPKKWVFGSQTWPKGKTFDLRPNLVSIEEEQTVEREREEKRRRRRRGRGRGEEEKPSKKVWKLTLSMDSSMDHMDFAWNCMDHMDF